MVLDHRAKEVIGIQIVGPIAAELTTTATYTIENDMTIYETQDMVHVFPTHSDMIKKAAKSFEMNLEELTCCVE
ncbi:hypothetical protein AKJ63_01525 [candidate division MSBL1 archaeon SCGC-AAA259D18]|uniref:Pyridine nucleotide-disulphide oxidoreductase dimerisation domain-containing protein n=1 Tax=candidate division MSBL1 archaeon SCGC-AAA259D18 TaxID=1698262 RepID=A0A133UB03_9EURY|nr:hypothetical protein AKJ63_01525 [candidate division MSBL1 archaeon SCGC-AAA259D18]